MKIKVKVMELKYSFYSVISITKEKDTREFLGFITLDLHGDWVGYCRCINYDKLKKLEPSNTKDEIIKQVEKEARAFFKTRYKE